MIDEMVQPIIDKLNGSTKVLIVLPQQPGGDDLGAALALSGYLKKLGKEITIISPTTTSPRFNFLPGYQDIVRSIKLNRSFVIDVNTKQTTVEELSYSQEPDKVSIYLKPKQGEFSKEDVSFRSLGYAFDVVITLGVASPEHLGEFYNRTTELFFGTPVINIDHQAYNENFAQFNLVDLSASSCSEIVFDLMKKLAPVQIDQDTATNLLTGIIIETNSFQHTRTTPQAFSKASELIGLGARQQEIINALFKNKSLGLLKLWGRVLARLKQDPAIRLVHSVSALTDLEKSEASEEDIQQIIKEMMNQLSFARLFVFIREIDDLHSEIHSATTAPVSLSAMFAAFKPEVLGQTTRFIMPLGLNEAEGEILNILRAEMGKS
ncbi:MAG: DHH family phosphoesterase [Candidatus Doudnabacteria bacterium]|nr:DHH family phosphoesterase [Candidatus Doudnabacteria bacterium]